MGGPFGPTHPSRLAKCSCGTLRPRIYARELGQGPTKSRATRPALTCLDGRSFARILQSGARPTDPPTRHRPKSPQATRVLLCATRSLTSFGGPKRFGSSVAKAASASDFHGSRNIGEAQVADDREHRGPRDHGRERPQDRQTPIHDYARCAEKDHRATFTDILHFPARVLVTEADHLIGGSGRPAMSSRR